MENMSHIVNLTVWGAPRSIGAGELAVHDVLENKYFQLSWREVKSLIAWAEFYNLKFDTTKEA